jgi:hypothetical protein
MYSHPLYPILPLSPPKFLHNNWTWRQRLEYEIREQDEEPKAEDRKRSRTKIRWREGGRRRKEKVFRPL